MFTSVPRLSVGNRQCYEAAKHQGLAGGRLDAGASPEARTEPTRQPGREACPPRYVGMRMAESRVQLDMVTGAGWKAGQRS